MNSFEDIKLVKLPDGREVRLRDEDSISIELVAGQSISESIPIDYPRAGYGGGSISVLGNDDYLLFAYYSGQSEEAFELFEIGDRLSRVFSSGYRMGEAASYGLSLKNQLLFQGLATLCSEWWYPWEDEEVEEDDEGESYLDFGCVNVLNLRTLESSTHQLSVYPSADWVPEENSYDPFMKPRLVEGNKLVLEMPWGREVVDFPLPVTVRFFLPQ